LRLALRSLDEAAQAALSEDLAQTVIALCDAALADCAIDRDALMARCHAAAKRIGGTAESLTLHLHPDDLALLDADALGGWQVIADAALERGSVLIEGPDGAVSDGPAEWRRAIAAGLRG
jgi:flagellar assembly protein FliH